jgi:hypothetical protein
MVNRSVMGSLSAARSRICCTASSGETLPNGIRCARLRRRWCTSGGRRWTRSCGPTAPTCESQHAMLKRDSNPSAAMLSPRLPHLRNALDLRNQPEEPTASGEVGVLNFECTLNAVIATTGKVFIVGRSLA